MNYTLLAIAVVLTLMWFLMVRPQRRRQAQTLAMQDALAIGDEVVTAGGFYGTIEALRGDDVMVEIAPGTSVRVARRAIVERVSGAEGEEEEAGAHAPNPPDAS